jgi:hypothetical protein
VIQQRILQRAVGVAGGRVDHQTGRFVDHQDVPVLEHDVERDCLRHTDNLLFGDGTQLQMITEFDPVPRAPLCAVDTDPTLPGPYLQPAARVVWK